MDAAPTSSLSLPTPTPTSSINSNNKLLIVQPSNVQPELVELFPNNYIQLLQHSQLVSSNPLSSLDHVKQSNLITTPLRLNLFKFKTLYLQKPIIYSILFSIYLYSLNYLLPTSILQHHYAFLFGFTSFIIGDDLKRQFEYLWLNYNLNVNTVNNSTTINGSNNVIFSLQDTVQPYLEKILKGFYHLSERESIYLYIEIFIFLFSILQFLFTLIKISINSNKNKNKQIENLIKPIHFEYLNLFFLIGTFLLNIYHSLKFPENGIRKYLNRNFEIFTSIVMIFGILNEFVKRNYKNGENIFKKLFDIFIHLEFTYFGINGILKDLNYLINDFNGLKDESYLKFIFKFFFVKFFFNFHFIKILFILFKIIFECGIVTHSLYQISNNLFNLNIFNYFKKLFNNKLFNRLFKYIWKNYNIEIIYSLLTLINLFGISLFSNGLNELFKSFINCNENIFNDFKYLFNTLFGFNILLNNLLFIKSGKHSIFSYSFLDTNNKMTTGIHLSTFGITLFTLGNIITKYNLLENLNLQNTLQNSLQNSLQNLNLQNLLNYESIILNGLSMGLYLYSFNFIKNGINSILFKKDNIITKYSDRLNIDNELKSLQYPTTIALTSSLLTISTKHLFSIYNNLYKNRNTFQWSELILLTCKDLFICNGSLIASGYLLKNTFPILEPYLNRPLKWFEGKCGKTVKKMVNNVSVGTIVTLAMTVGSFIIYKKYFN